MTPLDGIDLTDNPARVIKAIAHAQGRTLAPDVVERLADLERYCDQPVDVEERRVRYIRDPERPELPPVKQERTAESWRRVVEDD